jgi:heme/copper-type cytochrome/quinol oxidase subunit 2
MIESLSVLEIIAASILVVVIGILSVANVRLMISSRKISANLIQLTLDNMVLQESIDKLSQEYENLNLKESDGFVKFLSDSRAWAFEYIEKVQESIKELNLAMEDGVDEKIAAAYQDLLSHLPKEDGK